MVALEHKRVHGSPQYAHLYEDSILPVIQSALREAEISATDLSAVAVTHRPGMIGCLLVGISAAKALSWLYDLPLIGVDHIHAHIHAEGPINEIDFGI